MRSAEQWTALYEDGASSLNDAPLHITIFIRQIQRDAFDAGAQSMRLACVSLLAGFNRATINAVDIRHLEGRP